MGQNTEEMIPCLKTSQPYEEQQGFNWFTRSISACGDLRGAKVLPYVFIRLVCVYQRGQILSSAPDQLYGLGQVTEPLKTKFSRLDNMDNNAVS